MDFNQHILAWYQQYGRHDLPWQLTDAERGTRMGFYKVWLSEIMLQQTQVTTVINYFQRFTAQFANIEALAAADWDEVAVYWAGLGYYARARNLHKAAQTLANKPLPQTLDALMALPGVGRSTAGAILALGLGGDGVILDANVKRVLGRAFCPPLLASAAAYDHSLWQLATRHTPPAPLAADYAQAMMDIGATLCTTRNPKCTVCPVQTTCHAYSSGQISAYPPQKRKTLKPTKYATAWLCYNTQGEILWLKRPTPGIWAGLWALPMTDFALQQTPTNVQPLLEVKHSFTHFNLQLQVCAPIGASATVPTDGVYVSQAGASQLALPGLYSKILPRLYLPKP